MKAFLLCVIAAILALASAGDVVDLEDTNFDSLVGQTDVALVEFFAPWCGHCKRLAPEYEKAATILKGNDPPVTLAKVDCTESGKDSCSRFGVSGYPTLKIFRNGQFSQEYDGPREANGIVKFMRSQVGPSFKEIKTEADYEEFIAKDEVGVAGYFESSSSKLKDAFVKCADKLRESIRFGLTLESSVLKKAGHKEVIVLYRPKILANKFEESTAVYEGNADVEDVQKFIEENFNGLVGHRTTDNIAKFKNPLIVAYYKVDYFKNAKGTNYWRNRILKVAANYKGKINFAIANKDEFTSELNEYGFDYVNGDKPVVAGKDAKGQKFVLQGDFNADSFGMFVENFLVGNLTPYQKSEAVPDNSAALVKVAVAKNFDELVLKNDKDVLIEFYAPWCGHCKKLAPTFDELGKALEDEDSVIVVKMDATANDVNPIFEVQGFPTLYWYPKNTKTPKRYDGGRELDDFIKYIAKHSTDNLKSYDRAGKKTAKTEL